MKKDRPLKNMADSVRQRLLNVAKERREDYQLILTRYSLERLMYRLSCSQYRGEYVVKGAMVFSLWNDEPHRATRDLDLLGHGSNDLEELAKIFREIVATQVEDDGIRFDAQSIEPERIKVDQEYEGVRLNMMAYIDSARIKLNVDIGFGDAITPKAVEMSYPGILSFPGACLLSYPRETVIAEKFQALVALGIGNSRLKDFYDIWFLASKFNFSGPELGKALQSTFGRRHTALPASTPVGLTEEFAEDKNKLAQWQAFIKRTGVKGQEFGEVIKVLHSFLMPPSEALVQGKIFDKNWLTEGVWVKESEDKG